MSHFMAEIIGTMILIIFGGGVCAGVILNKSKSQNSGWIVITFGWGFAVAMAIFVTAPVGGAFINPAGVLGAAAVGSVPWANVPVLIVGEMIGAMIGACIVWLAYLPHWAATEDPAAKLAVFSTAPNIRNYPANLLCEIIGTFVLVFVGTGIGANQFAPGVGALASGFMIVAIGLSLGGPTGYAINPARDLGPRIAHALLPIAGKGKSDWEYSWIPVAGPIIGGILGALTYAALF